MEKAETFNCGATEPPGTEPAARPGSVHHATAQPLFQPLKIRIRGRSRFLSRLLTAADDERGGIPSTGSLTSLPKRLRNAGTWRNADCATPPGSNRSVHPDDEQAQS